MIDFKLHINLSTQETNINVLKNTIENNDYLLFLDGVILNESEIIEKHKVKSLFHYFCFSYSGYNYMFLDELAGEWNGFLYDKKLKKLLVFNNHQGSRKMFYTFQKNQFYCSNSVKNVTEGITQNNLSKTLDVEACYSLLVSSNLLENNTLVKEVKKLNASECIEIEIEKKTFKLLQYYNYNEIEIREKSLKEHVFEFNQLFQKAIAQEYEFDVKNNKKSMAFLSGGLDSRVNVLSAIQQNFAVDKTICFSQKNYLDHSISKKIANDFNLTYDFVPLDHINFVKDIEFLSSKNEYSVYFTGSSHVKYALDTLNIDTSEFGLMHSGQIGDGILGNFNSSKHIEKPKANKMVKNNPLAHKIDALLQTSMQKYATEELFLLQNIAFNKTVAGSYVVEDFATLVSPFFHPEVMKYALSIPPKYKYNHLFYFEWIKQCIPTSTQYIWETTKMKPTRTNGKFMGEHIINRIYKYYNIAKNSEYKTSMVPYQFYYDKDESIALYFQQYYQDRISVLQAYPELKKEVAFLFNQPQFGKKVVVLTLLSGIFDIFKT